MDGVMRLALHSIFGEASRFSMPKHTLTGNIKRHRAFPSKILGNRRDVLVYLPRGYRRFSQQRYPVLYLQDGQNVFDAATSFSGVEWGVDEAAERLIKENLVEPLIVVAVANTGEQRVDEYAPTRGVIDARAKRQETQQRSGPKVRAISDERTEAVHRPKISNHPGGGIHRAGRFIPGRSRYAGDWNFIPSSLRAAYGDVAINLVGQFRNLSTRRFDRAETTIENLARYRHSRTWLGTRAGVTQSSCRERLETQQGPPVHGSPRRRS